MFSTLYLSVGPSANASACTALISCFKHILKILPSSGSFVSATLSVQRSVGRCCIRSGTCVCCFRARNTLNFRRALFWRCVIYVFSFLLNFLFFLCTHISGIFRYLAGSCNSGIAYCMSVIGILSFTTYTSF